MDLLVIDDDAALRRTLRLTLESMGHAVEEAASGEQAMNLLGHGRYDVALLDVQLSDGSGLDLIRELAERVPRPKIVVLTAGVLEPQREAALEAGCDAFLGKPYMPQELLDTLSTLIAAE